nr:primosomal protein N' [Euzebyales bacterium]
MNGLEQPRYARVVVAVSPSHLDRPFDYLVPAGVSVGVGRKVRVVFSGRRRDGWVVGLAGESEADPARVRPLTAVLGDIAWFDEADLRLFRWVADRYAATLADVLR